MEIWPNLWYVPILLLISDRCLLSASSSPILGRRISLVSLSSRWWYSSMLSLVVLLVNLSQVFLSFSWPRVQGYFSVFSLFCKGIRSFSKSVCSLIFSVNASIALAILSRAISRRAVLWWLVSSIFLWIELIMFSMHDSWLSRRKLGWASNDSPQFILLLLGVPEGVLGVYPPCSLCLGEGAKGGMSLSWKSLFADFSLLFRKVSSASSFVSARILLIILETSSKVGDLALFGMAWGCIGGGNSF